MYRFFIKRFLDVVIAFLVLIILSPLVVIITLWLHFVNKGSGAFFSQKRAGKNGVVFHVIKFKSMTDEKNENGELLPDSQRITKIGKFIRSKSIDEIPQLFNVLKGDMSLIGPRPLLPEYTPLYDLNQIKRLTVKPGITGWAQIHGRNSLKLSTRFKMDVWYTEHLSLWIDIKIFFMTIYNLFKSKVVVCRQDLVGVDDLGFDKKAFGENRK